MRTIALILAKQNSRRLANKNWRDFNGKPMFVWNIMKCVPMFEETYVSSDAGFILDIAKQHGAIPLHRPAHLCGDTPSVEVFRHVLEQTNHPDAIVSVQANSPTVKASVIKSVKDMMDTGSFQEVMTARKVGDEEYKLNGSVWALTEARIENYINPYENNVDATVIDDSIDIHDYDDIF